MRCSRWFYFRFRLWKIIPEPLQLRQKCVKEASLPFVSAISVTGATWHLRQSSRKEEWIRPLTSRAESLLTGLDSQADTLRCLHGGLCPLPPEAPSQTDKQLQWMKTETSKHEESRLQRETGLWLPAGSTFYILHSCSLFSAWPRSNDKISLVSRCRASQLWAAPGNRSFAHTEAADAAAPPVSAVANRGHDPRTTRSSEKRRTSSSATILI